MVGSKGHAKALDYLVGRLGDAGCVPYSGKSFKLPYRQNRTNSCNAVGVIPGRDRKLPPLLIGAHYDSALRFGHRVFLSATPHNGHSNSFSALLEILDPKRFTRGVPVVKARLDAVMVRRLKEDIRKLPSAPPPSSSRPAASSSTNWFRPGTSTSASRQFPPDVDEVLYARRLVASSPNAASMAWTATRWPWISPTTHATPRCLALLCTRNEPAPMARADTAATSEGRSTTIQRREHGKPMALSGRPGAISDGRPAGSATRHPTNTPCRRWKPVS